MESLQLFNFEGQDVRAGLGPDGDPWWVHNDVCRCLGIADAPQAAERLDDDEKGWVDLPTPGGTQRIRVVNEPGLYALVLRSKSPGAKRFKRWLTHEVIPAIRKTGRFSMESAAMDLANDPEAALMLALTEVRRRKAAEAERDQARALAAALETPARAWSAMADTSRDYSVGDAAKILSRDPAIDMGEQRLFRYLVAQGLVYVETEGTRRSRNAYKPYQRHVDAGRFVLRMGTRWQNPKTEEWHAGTPQLRITARGLAFLHKELGGVGALQLDDGSANSGGGITLAS